MLAWLRRETSTGGGRGAALLLLPPLPAPLISCPSPLLLLPPPLLRRPSSSRSSSYPPYSFASFSSSSAAAAPLHAATTLLRFANLVHARARLRYGDQAQRDYWSKRGPRSAAKLDRGVYDTAVATQDLRASYPNTTLVDYDIMKPMATNRPKGWSEPVTFSHVSSSEASDCGEL